MKRYKFNKINMSKMYFNTDWFAQIIPKSILKCFNKFMQ